MKEVTHSYDTSYPLESQVIIRRLLRNTDNWTCCLSFLPNTHNLIHLLLTFLPKSLKYFSILPIDKQASLYLHLDHGSSCYPVKVYLHPSHINFTTVLTLVWVWFSGQRWYFFTSVWPAKIKLFLHVETFSADGVFGNGLTNILLGNRVPIWPWVYAEGVYLLGSTEHRVLAPMYWY